MANSLTISYGDGIWKVARGRQVLGQGRALETALENAITEKFPPEARFHCAEVLRNVMGDVQETHGQIATTEP